MEESTNRQGETGCAKRPPCVGLMAFLMGMLIGLFIPLSRALRKSRHIEKQQIEK